jgi:hypothetical protein
MFVSCGSRAAVARRPDRHRGGSARRRDHGGGGKRAVEARRSLPAGARGKGFRAAPQHARRPIRERARQPRRCVLSRPRAGSPADKLHPRTLVDVDLPALLPQKRCGKQARHRSTNDGRAPLHVPRETPVLHDPQKYSGVGPGSEREMTRTTDHQGLCRGIRNRGWPHGYHFCYWHPGWCWVVF